MSLSKKFEAPVHIPVQQPAPPRPDWLRRRCPHSSHLSPVHPLDDYPVFGCVRSTHRRLIKPCFEQHCLYWMAMQQSGVRLSDTLWRGCLRQHPNWFERHVALDLQAPSRDLSGQCVFLWQELEPYARVIPGNPPGSVYDAFIELCEASRSICFAYLKPVWHSTSAGLSPINREQFFENVRLQHSQVRRFRRRFGPRLRRRKARAEAERRREVLRQQAALSRELQLLKEMQHEIPAAQQTLSVKEGIEEWRQLQRRFPGKGLSLWQIIYDPIVVCWDRRLHGPKLRPGMSVRLLAHWDD